MDLFSPVQIPPDPGRHGKLWYTLPWSVLDFFDLGAFFIHEKDHIDQDGHTVLENLARTIHQLILVFDERAQIDSRLLGEIIPYLRQIEEEHHPIKIFFPQIHAKTAPPDRGAERERIEAAQAEARENAARYKEQAVGLLGLLVPKQQPGRGAPDAEVIRQLKAFEQLCEKASYEQQGLVAKALNFISKKAVEKAQEISQAFFRSKTVERDQSCGIAGNHPLVQLLSLLSDQTFRSGVDIQARVKDALPRLEQYHPSFRGVQQYVETRVKAPFTDFRALRQALHQFLMLQWIPKVNPHEHFQDALIHVYTTARNLGVADAPHIRAPERVELDWMLRGIEDVSSEQLDLAKELCRAQITLENERMKFYHAALERSADGVPPLNKSDKEKIDWASRQEEHLPASLTEARSARHEIAQRFNRDVNTIKSVTQAKNLLKAAWANKYIRISEGGESQPLTDAIAIVQAFQESIRAREALLRAIAAEARRLGIASAPGEVARLDQIATWVGESLRLRDHLEHRDFVRMIYRLNGTIKTPDEINMDLLDFYKRALAQGVAGVPDRHTEVSFKIEWARQVINGELPCDKEALDLLIAAIRDDLHDQFVAGLIHFHGVLRRNKSAPDTRDMSRKMAWGQEQVKGCFHHLFHPEDPEGMQSAELVWMATAHYQQLSELHHIRGEILRQKGAESIQTILHSINLLIKALEMQPDLLGAERAQALTAMVVEPTLDWITVAHDFLRSGQISTLKQGEVDQQFEPIYREIRAAQAHANRGSYLEAFKQLKVVLEKSPLSAKLLEQGADKAALEQLERAFGIFLKEKPPQKPSPLRGEVLQALGRPAETPLTKKILVEGVELQRKRMISNGLVLAGYKILALIFKGPKGQSEGLRQSFASYRTAVDTIAGERHDYDPSRVDGAVRAMVEGSGYRLDSQEGREMLERVRGAISEAGRRFSGQLQSEEAQEALHETTYQNLLSVLITVNTKDHTLQSHVARGFLPLILWAIKLFADPFSKTLIEKFTYDIILESKGQLTDTHLHPIQGLNEGLGTYNEKMRQWGDITSRNAVVDGTLHSSLHDVPSSGQSAAMEAMLKAPRTYPGRMTHTQIDQWGLYIAVDQYLYVAHLCQNIDQAFAMIRERLFEKSHESSPLINAAGFAIKGLLSVFPYLFVWGQYFLLKISEILINFSLQQIAKFAIWYTQAGTEILMRFINALVKSSEYTTGLDKILLEKLKELEQDLEREARLAKGEDRGPSSVNHEPIRSLLSHVKETVETIKCDTPDEARKLRNSIQELLTLEAFATDQVKKLVVPMMISTIESFLNQESMLLALYRGFDLMNQGLREEAPQLEEAQMAELRQEVQLQGREVTPEDISDKMRRVHQGLSREMQATLKRILENAAYPTIDRKIDQSIKFPGQVVSECIGWLEKALYAPGANGGVKSENIVVLLEARLGELDAAERDRGEILRDLYMDFSHFIKKFREYQSDLDQNPSYNGILLKKQVFEVIATPLNPLAIALAQFIKDPEGGGKQARVVECIRALKETTTGNRPALNKLRASEAWNHDERHRGVLGQTIGSWEKLFTYLKEHAKAPVHEGLNRYVGLIAENLTAIPKKPILVQHLLRSAMVPYIRMYQ
ncbi:MAG: hypothetical protein KDK96_03645 [Chlamydiia bacterium]|nr:hypothetical protein [Chlamydiia bacterium]